MSAVAGFVAAVEFEAGGEAQPGGAPEAAFGAEAGAPGFDEEFLLAGVVVVDDPAVAGWLGEGEETPAVGGRPIDGGGRQQQADGEGVGGLPDGAADRIERGVAEGGIEGEAELRAPGGGEGVVGRAVEEHLAFAGAPGTEIGIETGHGEGGPAPAGFGGAGGGQNGGEAVEVFGVEVRVAAELQPGPAGDDAGGEGEAFELGMGDWGGEGGFLQGDAAGEFRIFRVIEADAAGGGEGEGGGGVRRGP